MVTQLVNGPGLLYNMCKLPARIAVKSLPVVYVML